MVSVPCIVDPRGPTGLSRTGLEHHQSVVHLLQDFLVDGLSQVNELVGVNCNVIYLHKHLGNTERELVITNDLVGVYCNVIQLCKTHIKMKRNR